MPPRLFDKTALVVGGGAPAASMGNGSAIALRMAAEGASVVVVDRDSAAAERTQQAIRQAGGHCDVVEADVCTAAQVERAVHIALEKLGRLDVLVNNVGAVALGGPEELSLDDWDQAFALNVRSAFLVCKHALPAMRAAGRGSIVQVSSVASIRWGGTAYCSYAASKAALNALGHSIAMQYAPMGIRCNNVLLGLIDTALVRNQLTAAHAQGVAHLLASRNALCPTGAMGSPWDAAEATVFLASDASKYITGVDLVVDGGLHHQVAAPAHVNTPAAVIHSH